MNLAEARMKQTECEKKGYKVGQVFKVMSGHYLFTAPGTILVLEEITPAPRIFPILGDRFNFTVVAHSQGGHEGETFAISLDDVKRIYPLEVKEKVAVTNCIDGVFVNKFVNRETANAIKELLA